MPVFKGTTSSSATSSPYNIAALIRSFSIVNKGAGANNVVVAVLYGSTNIYILNAALDAGEQYVYTGQPITLPAEHVIYVLASADCDYYFSLE